MGMEYHLQGIILKLKCPQNIPTNPKEEKLMAHTLMKTNGDREFS